MSRKDAFSECPCGKVKITAERLPSGVFPNVPASERSRLAVCRAVYSLTPNCVELQDLSGLTLKIHSQFCTDVRCIKCGMQWRFFVVQTFCVAGVVEGDTKANADFPPGPDCALTPPVQFPASLRPFVSPDAAPSSVSVKREFVAAQDDYCNCDYDCDYDFMFSAKFARVIGSYRPCGVVLREGSKLSSKSYTVSNAGMTIS
jgi:hypothetical protein